MYNLTTHFLYVTLLAIGLKRYFFEQTPILHRQGHSPRVCVLHNVFHAKIFSLCGKCWANHHVQTQAGVHAYFIVPLSILLSDRIASSSNKPLFEYVTGYIFTWFALYPKKKQEDLHSFKADLACKLWETKVIENCGYLWQPSRLKNLIAVLTYILN